MKPFFLLLLLTAMLNVYGCQVRQPAEVRAPLTPARATEAPPPPPAVLQPTTPKVAVDTALWHLRYAHGLLEKRQPLP